MSSRKREPVDQDVASMAEHLSMALDPVRFAAKAGLICDPWQAEVLRQKPSRGVACCSRQSGKSTVAAIAVLHEALFNPKSLSLVVAPSERQSKEFLTKVKDLMRELPYDFAVEGDTQMMITFKNKSRIIAGPGSEATTRGFTINGIAVIDEASRTEDSLLASISPALSVGGGRLLAISTPAGTSGWFYNAFNSLDDAGWQRWHVTAEDNPRLTADFLAKERISLGDKVFRQEYMGEFVSDGASVFDPDSILRAFGGEHFDEDDDEEEFVPPPALYIEPLPVFGLTIERTR